VALRQEFFSDEDTERRERFCRLRRWNGKMTAFKQAVFCFGEI